MSGSLRHSLRLTACKPDDASSGLRAQLHRSFVAVGIVDPLRAAPHLAHLEAVCDRIISAVEAQPREGSAACLATTLGATACHDPRVTQAAIHVLLAREIVSETSARPYLNLTRSLVEEAFPARLAACLRQSPALAGTQIVRLQRLSNQASLYLTARLHPHETLLQPSCEWLEGASAQLAPTDRETTFFCAETMADLSRRETARGVRAFAQDDLKTARERFCTAIAYDADNPLPIWNLARLDLRAGRRLDALQRYAALLELVPGAADLLHGEMDVVTERNPDRLPDLMEPVQPCMDSFQATARREKKGARA